MSIYCPLIPSLLVSSFSLHIQIYHNRFFPTVSPILEFSGEACNCDDCPASCEKDDDNDNENNDNSNDDSDKQKNYDKYTLPAAGIVGLLLTVGLLFMAHISSEREGTSTDLVLTNLSSKSTAPLAEKDNLYKVYPTKYSDKTTKDGGDAEEVPIKLGKVDSESPPVNRIQLFIRFGEVHLILHL